MPRRNRSASQAETHDDSFRVPWIPIQLRNIYVGIMTIGNQGVDPGVRPRSIFGENSLMRYHIQGIFLLLIVLIAVLFTARMAAPVLSDALGDEGAIVAESAEVTPDADLAAGEAEEDLPLTGEEVGQIQTDLTTLGFDPGAVDGIMGDATQNAIDAAIVQYQLDVTASNRAIFDYVRSLADALAAANAADSATNDAGDADAEG